MRLGYTAGQKPGRLGCEGPVVALGTISFWIVVPDADTTAPRKSGNSLYRRSIGNGNPTNLFR